MEVAANSAALSAIKSVGVFVPLSLSTWHAARLAASSAVDAPEFAVISTAYHRVEALVNARFEPGAAVGAGAKAAAAAAFERGELAADIVLKRGWPDQRDRKALQERLTDLVAPDVKP
jgi:hypothetical protein